MKGGTTEAMLRVFPSLRATGRNYVPGPTRTKKKSGAIDGGRGPDWVGRFHTRGCHSLVIVLLFLFLVVVPVSADSTRETGAKVDIDLMQREERKSIVLETFCAAQHCQKRFHLYLCISVMSLIPCV